MRRLAAPEGGSLARERFYFVHGNGHRTTALLGTQRMLRFLGKTGYPPVAAWRIFARLHDMEGRELASAEWMVPGGEEATFESGRFFADERAVEGSVLLELKEVEFESDFDPALPIPDGDFNGVLLVHKPGSYVTGVHMYHGVSPASRVFLYKYAVKAWLKRAYYALSDGLGGPWAREAVGASVVRSSPGGRGFAVLHTDHPVVLAPSILEYRSETGAVRRHGLPAAVPHATIRVDVPPLGSGAEEWGQLLCALPPFGVSRFVTGQRFADGRLSFDHTYFQQRADTAEKVRGEVRWFDRRLLADGVIGPSHPWPCFHDEHTETLIAMCKQFEPEKGHVYDVRVFDEDGRLVLERLGAIHVPPFGLAIYDLSAELRRQGRARFQGTYLVSHSARNDAQLLPNRIHAQGLYRFKGDYWNAVQSDASIWASPDPKVPEIEALSLARVRRKQYWFAPAIDSPELETLISVSNLSYSLRYRETQTLGLRYIEGGRVLGEREVTLKPFGASLLAVREFFGELMTRRQGTARGCVLIYPKTGVTYCASALYRERRTGVFVVEHVLPLPKYPHEVSS